MSAHTQARACVDAGAAAIVINAEDLMEGAAWDGAAINRLLDAVGMDHLLFEAPHSQVALQMAEIVIHCQTEVDSRECEHWIEDSYLQAQPCGIKALCS